MKKVIFKFLAGLMVMAATGYFAAMHAPMPASYDSAVMLRAASAGNLTVTATTAALTIDGTGWNGISVRLHVPQATGTSPTLDAKLQTSPDNSAWTDAGSYAQVTAAGEYRIRLATSKKYVRAVLTVAGTSPNFGAVQLGFETGGEQAA